MSAGSDRSLAGTAGGGCDRSQQPGRGSDRSQAARGGLRPTLAPPNPTRSNSARSAATPKDTLAGPLGKASPKTSFRQWVPRSPAWTTHRAPRQGDEHGCSYQGLGEPRGGAPGGAETNASQRASEWTRVSTLDPGDILPGHARARRRYINRSECALQA